MKKTGEAVVLRIFLSESATDGGRPLYEKIVAKARQLHLAGATVLRGLYGFARRGDSPEDAEGFRHEQAPIVIELIDTEDNLGRLLPFLDETVEHGLVTLEAIKVVRYSPSKITQF